MYIYNVTINIDESEHDRWLLWMQETHIPDMLATGKFTKAKMCRVLVEEEMGGVTYSVQYTTKDKKTLWKYYDEDAERLRRAGMKHFANKFVAFRTELELISEHNTTLLGATEYLFTYGTLQDETIQSVIFSRKLSGSQDSLLGYKISDEKVAEAYPVIFNTGNPADTVMGNVYLVTNTELLKADAYEGVAYKRIKVTLESGKKAWVYLGISNESKPK